MHRARQAQRRPPAPRPAHLREAKGDGVPLSGVICGRKALAQLVYQRIALPVLLDVAQQLRRGWCWWGQGGEMARRRAGRHAPQACVPPCIATDDPAEAQAARQPPSRAA